MAAGVVVADMPRLGRPSAGRHSLPCVHPLEARGELTCDPSVVDDQRPVRADGGSLRELGDAREKPGREPRVSRYAIVARTSRIALGPADTTAIAVRASSSRSGEMSNVGARPARAP